MAMAALGASTDLTKLKKLGPRPAVLALGLWGWLLVGCGSAVGVLHRIFS